MEGNRVAVEVATAVEQRGRDDVVWSGSLLLRECFRGEAGRGKWKKKMGNLRKGVLSAERKRLLRRGRAAMAGGRKKRKKNRTANGLGAAVLSQGNERERMAVWQMARESGWSVHDG